MGRFYLLAADLQHPLWRSPAGEAGPISAGWGLAWLCGRAGCATCTAPTPFCAALNGTAGHACAVALTLMRATFFRCWVGTDLASAHRNWRSGDLAALAAHTGVNPRCAAGGD